VVRGLKVREERILADRKLAKSNTQIDELLRACWIETHDPGPYQLTEQGLDWSRVLQGDRFYALLQIRIATYGPEYAFSVACREEHCRAPIEWELDLRELEVRWLSELSRSLFVGGNRFETVLPDAHRRVEFRLMTGEDERKLPVLRRNADGAPMSAVLAHRCNEIEGVSAHEKRHYIEELSMADADALVEAMNAADCGVVTKVEIECPECFARQEIELPFNRGFFARKKPSRAPSPTACSAR
jgi:hypothetical protein